MTVTDKEAKDFWKMIQKLKKDDDKEFEPKEDKQPYNSGKAYTTFLKYFYKGKSRRFQINNDSYFCNSYCQF